MKILKAIYNFLVIICSYINASGENVIAAFMSIIFVWRLGIREFMLSDIKELSKQGERIYEEKLKGISWAISAVFYIVITCVLFVVLK